MSWLVGQSLILSQNSTLSDVGVSGSLQRQSVCRPRDVIYFLKAMTNSFQTLNLKVYFCQVYFYYLGLFLYIFWPRRLASLTPLQSSVFVKYLRLPFISSKHHNLVDFLLFYVQKTALTHNVREAPSKKAQALFGHCLNSDCVPHPALKRALWGTLSLNK